MYIDNYSIAEQSHSLHYMLATKVLVFLAFCLATGADTLFVRSDLTCDASRDCYILDNNYEDLPLTDCTDILNSKNLTAVCYELVWDLAGAGSAMGGLLSITVFETAIIAYLSIFLYRYCCYRQSEAATKRRCIWICIQLFTAGYIIGGFVGLYSRFGNKNAVSELRKAGNWIQFLGYPCSIATSVLVPWQLVVEDEPIRSCCTSQRDENRTLRITDTQSLSAIPV